MKVDEADRPIRRLFQEMRREDVRRALPFARLLGPAIPAPAPMPGIRWMRLTSAFAAAAVLVLCFSLAWLRMYTGTPSTVIDPELVVTQWQALSQWETRTDNLLDAPTIEWASGFTFASDALLSTDSTTVPALQDEQKGNSNET